MKILGIETSCDDTAAALVQEGRKVSSSVVASQVSIHRKYGGVVPELASRHHVEAILPVIQEALSQAEMELKDIDGIRHPGARAGRLPFSGNCRGKILILCRQTSLHRSESYPGPCDGDLSF